MTSTARRQIIGGGGGAPINKRRRRRPQIVGGAAGALSMWRQPHAIKVMSVWTLLTCFTKFVPLTAAELQMVNTVYYCPLSVLNPSAAIFMTLLLHTLLPYESVLFSRNAEHTACKSSINAVFDSVIHLPI